MSPQAVAAVAANSHRDFPQHMAQAYIHTIASGGQAPTYKYYFYSQALGPGGSPGGLFLVEMVVRADLGSASVTIKVQDAARQQLQAFLDRWNTCLGVFLSG